MKMILRRKLRHHRTARIIVLGSLVGSVLVIMLLGTYFLVKLLSPLASYEPGQAFNPFRFMEDLGIGLFFFLVIWKMPTMNQSLTWSTIVLSIYNGSFVVGFIEDVIFHTTLGPIDIATFLLHILALGACGFVVLGPGDVKKAIRIIFATAILSWATGIAWYVSFYGLEIGAGRALAGGVAGPFIVIVGTVIRTRGDWISREKESYWELSKNLEWEKWTGADAEVIGGDIDSYDRVSRNVQVHTCRFKTGGTCVDRTLKMSDLIGKLVWDEIDEFSGRNAHLLVKEDQIIDMSFWGRPMREDPPILLLLCEVCSRLEVYDVDTERLFWKHNEVPVSRWPTKPLPPYVLSFDESLAGKLSPQEWAPLMASAIIFHSKLWKRRLFGTIRWVLFTAALLSGMTVVLDVLLWRFFGPEVETYLLLLVGALVVGAVGSLKLQAKTSLNADKLAAELIGASIFLEALSRVEAAKLAERKSWMVGLLARLFSTDPRIRDRMSSISKLVSRAPQTPSS